MMPVPVLLESAAYQDLRSEWFRSSHEPGLFVIEGRADMVRQELQKLSTHWQQQVIRVLIDDPYEAMPLMYQLYGDPPVNDLVVCKNTLLRFQRSGWEPGTRKWVLVEVASYLDTSDLKALYHILYRQNMKGVSVLLFFHQYPVRLGKSRSSARLAVSLVRDTQEQTSKLLQEELRMAEKKKERSLVLYNKLAWILLYKSDDSRRHMACFHFFKYNAIFQRLSSAQQAVLWFELGQILTKKEGYYSAARCCYDKAREVLVDEHLTDAYRIGKEAALDNGEALIEMQEGRTERAIELELRAGERISELAAGPDRHAFQIQTALNVAGLRLRAGQLTQAQQTLVTAEKLCTGEHAPWLNHVFQLKMAVYQQLGEHEQEYEQLLQLLRFKTSHIHSKLLSHAIEMAGNLHRQGDKERAAHIYRLLLMGMPAARLPQVRMLRQTLDRLGQDTPLDKHVQDEYIDRLESKLETWDQLQQWNERRKSGWLIHS